MAKKKLQKQSKRMTCRKKYKIIKKVNEHHRKIRKEEKRNANKKWKPKDPGIPNLYPFKEQLLKQIEDKKKQEQEKKQKQKDKKRKENNRKRKLEDLQKDAEKRAKQFAKKQALESSYNSQSTNGNIETSRKSFYKEFRKVIEAADVVIEVLDARDPLGCRCTQLEEMIMASGTNKKLVLLLNKIDLVPRDIVEKWLKYLRSEFPAIAFKASTQNQKQKLSQSKISVNLASKDLLQTSTCLGAGTLLKLLGNYSRSLDRKTAITVGIVGFPNVGKSSVINSLKRSKVCNVGSAPGVTKNMQEIQLDSHVKLLDSPGIVMATGTTDTQIILRNAVKVETLDDPIGPVEAILSRCNKMQIMKKYCVPDYNNTVEFLVSFAKRLGKLKKGGIPDQLAAAKILLQDWNGGKITFYTHPPSRETSDYDAAKVVEYLGGAFDLAALEKDEKDDLDGLVSALDNALVLESGRPVEMTDVQEEEENESADQEEESEASDTEDMADTDEEEVTLKLTAVEQNVLLKIKDKKTPQIKEKETKLDSVDSENNIQANREIKKAFKKKQKEDKKKMNQLLDDGDTKMADDTYDFNAILT